MTASAASGTTFAHSLRRLLFRRRLAGVSAVAPSAAALLASATGVSGAGAVRPPCSCWERRADGSDDSLQNCREEWKTPLGKNPGFHSSQANPVLVRHLPRLVDGIEKGEVVFVPLFGKTMDMLYLGEQGYSVVGVEGVLRPLLEFRDEHRCTPKGPLYLTKDPDPVCVKGFKKSFPVSLGDGGHWVCGAGFEPAERFEGSRPGQVFKTGDRGLGYYTDSPRMWRGKIAAHGGAPSSVDVIQADIFDVTSSLIADMTCAKDGSFKLVYDHGSIVALPPLAREQYVAVLSNLVRPGGRILMNTLEYKQVLLPFSPERSTPPPFSVPLSELRRLFPGDNWTVEDLGAEASNICHTNTGFKDIDVRERVFLITRS